MKRILLDSDNYLARSFSLSVKVLFILCFAAPEPQTTNGDSVSSRDPAPCDPAIKISCLLLVVQNLLATFLV